MAGEIDSRLMIRPNCCMAGPCKICKVMLHDDKDVSRERMAMVREVGRRIFVCSRQSNQLVTALLSTCFEEP